jgi:predicted protein tyrosine phosphatase
MTIMRNGRPTIIDTISTRTIEAIISRDEMQCAIYQNVIDKENLVLISIGEPGREETILTSDFVKDFKDVLQVEFWDIEEDFSEYKIIADEQAKLIQDFIIKNKDNRFIINCQAGISRSAAVGKAIECIKFFGIGEEAKYNYLTSFNSEISAHSRYCPNLTVFDKIVKEYK